ncbi:MAG: zinc-dependent peptidase [Phycisphaerales bacterium JB060]
MLGFLRRRRRERVGARPLPEAWWATIDRRVPMIAAMDEADRRELGRIVQILLDEKRFEGCGGLEMTDEIRVTIAAQAAVLLLHRPDPGYYPTLRSILVYPRAYFANTPRQNPDGTVTEGPQGRLGESWFRGALVLSWDDVVRGAADEGDGRNVTLHEFAHQLDGQSGGMNGAPALASPARYRDWARVLGEEYAQLAEDLHRGQAGGRTLIDPYGATNPPEFFAVVTELYFERPGDLRRQHPELYEQLAAFYGPAPTQPNA